MGFAHVRDQLKIVVAQLRQHVERCDVFGVVVQDALLTANLTDRAKCRAADLAHAFRNHVGDGENLTGLLVQQQVVVAKVRTRDVPVKILGW